MPPRLLAVILLEAAGADPQGDGGAAASLEARARLRTDELIRGGFNTTQTLTVRSAESTAVEFFVPPIEDRIHQVVVNAAVERGLISIRVTGPDGGVVGAWSGQEGEVAVTRALRPGRYELSIDARGAGAGSGVLAFKGPVVLPCRLDAAQVVERPGRPQDGFHWPYLFFLPPGATHLLVLPNNTGFVTDDVGLLRASAACHLRKQLALAQRLKVALVMPLFPRSLTSEKEDLYLHALTAQALTATAPAVRRVDLQLLAMIDDARAGTPLAKRVLISGFSASGSFAHRFALLHPERVLASASGSPGGWPTAPTVLPWPVGLEVKHLGVAAPDPKALRQVQFFVYLGADDANDSVPYRDSFSAEAQDLVMERFGRTPVSRWKAAEELHRAAGLKAQFRFYPGVAHVVSSEMARDVEAFFAKALGR